MELRVTRPGFIREIQALADGDEPVPHLPSIERWRSGSRAQAYDPNADATRQEMRSFVCGQCHVEYYCGPKVTLFFPWNKGLKVEEIEASYDGFKFPDGHRFFDWKHAETGAEVLKAQHPEFEMWSQGIHARSGVACADCQHAVQARGCCEGFRSLGAQSDAQHLPRVPGVPSISGAGDPGESRCDPESHERLDAAVWQGPRRHAGCDQERAGEWGERAGPGRGSGASAQGAMAVGLRCAENSMGFHAPAEAARILAESIDYSRQAELLAQSLGTKAPASP